MSRPVLYANPDSNHSNLVTTFLAAANALGEVEVRIVDFLKGEHKHPAYVTINPVGQVPALQNGNVNVFESSAIVRYLAVKFGISLYPLTDLARLAAVDSAYEHVRQKAWDHCSGLVFQGVYMKRFFGRDGDLERAKTCRENLDKAMEFIGNNFFKSGKWMATPEFSLADVVLGTVLMHARIAGFESKNQKVQEFVKNWQEQSWYPQTSYAKMS